MIEGSRPPLIWSMAGGGLDLNPDAAAERSVRQPVQGPGIARWDIPASSDSINRRDPRPNVPTGTGAKKGAQRQSQDLFKKA